MMQNGKPLIKVGMLVAYDWELLKNSVPRVYNSADIICLALDSNRISWSCNKFEFDDERFYRWVKENDHKGKIRIYEDSFSLKELNARENCNRQRKMLADYMGKGGWHIQVDADEYFLDFDAFVNYLKAYDPDPQPEKRAVNICVNFIPLFKKVDGGYLFVDFGNGPYETIPLATNRPEFTRARQNGHFNHVTSQFIVHETWARGEEELVFKLTNWGHSAEELEKRNRVEKYLQMWRSLDSGNYSSIRNFHPATPAAWPKLGFCKGENIGRFIENLRKDHRFGISAIRLWYLNNRNIARLRFYFNKISRIFKENGNL